MHENGSTPMMMKTNRMRGEEKARRLDCEVEGQSHEMVGKWSRPGLEAGSLSA